MRFGQQLRTSLIRDYEYSYIAYDDLKARLKTPLVSDPTTANSKPARRPWNEDDEQQFVRQLEQELDKVFTFQHVRSDDIVRRIRTAEKEVREVIERLNDDGNINLQQEDGLGEGPTEEDFMMLEEDLSDIIADVHDLAKFTQLNYTGFQKIIKKHDKMTSWHLKPVFSTRLSAKPFWKDNYDALIVKLSRLYDLVRTRGNPVKGDSAAGGGQQNFVRQTTKYWVHKDNITELKLIILKHLPVLVFNPSKEFETKDSAISSIYYDNPETWELYTGRLKKTEGAEAIRLRWYGGMESDTIFVERKTHREDWTGEKSVKARFTLKEKNVNDFMAGRLTVDKVFEKMRKDGKKSDEEISNLEQLAREIQFRVITRKLVPVTRSFYNRTAFQLPGDARVRISLDTELTMTREDNLDGRARAGNNWRRTDIGIDYPFSQLPPEDAERFPYAVLEVKLQTQAGQDPPQWIRDLTASHLVEAVPKYSKFIHGTATLNPNRINLIPFWLPQMEIDIRKPVSHYFGIEHPGQSSSASTSANMDDDDDFSDEDDDHLTLKAEDAYNRAHKDVNADDDTETLKRLREARDLMEQHDLEQRQDAMNDNANGKAAAKMPQGGPNALDIEERIAAQPLYDGDEEPPHYDSDEEDNDVPRNNQADLVEARLRGIWSYRWVLTKQKAAAAASALGTALHIIKPAPKPTFMPDERSADANMGVPPVSQSYTRKRFVAPPGKRIHVPVRVEPKVYFAAERTFLAWLEFSIIIGGIAATLLNFGDNVALTGAWAFTIVAVLCLLYSLGLYLWRVMMIRKRRAANFHDSVGPTILCVGLLVAVATSFGMRFTYGGEGGLRDSWS